MKLDAQLKALAEALPERFLPDVCLTYSCWVKEGWSCFAGGNPMVHIGESGGEFQGEGDTAEEAIQACLRAVKNA